MSEKRTCGHKFILPTICSECARYLAMLKARPMTDPFDTVKEWREQFIAVTDPLDVWLCIDGNYVRPATKQESEMLTALASIEERIAQVERWLAEAQKDLLFVKGERDDYRARVEHFRSDPLVQALEAAERERDDERTGRHMAEDERGRLQHIIDCADTPLMRDVLRERDELGAALRRIADGAESNPASEVAEVARRALASGKDKP